MRRRPAPFARQIEYDCRKGRSRKLRSCPIPARQTGPAFLRIQVVMQFRDAGRVDTGGRGRRGVAEMLAEMERRLTARNLHIDRVTGLETGLPIDLEAQKIQMEFLGLVACKNPKYGHGPLKLNCHRRRPPASLRAL